MLLCRLALLSSPLTESDSLASLESANSDESGPAAERCRYQSNCAMHCLSSAQLSSSRPLMSELSSSPSPAPSANMDLAAPNDHSRPPPNRNIHWRRV